jgi:hypothetical protein
MQFLKMETTEHGYVGMAHNPHVSIAYFDIYY